VLREKNIGSHVRFYSASEGGRSTRCGRCADRKAGDDDFALPATHRAERTARQTAAARLRKRRAQDLRGILRPRRLSRRALGPAAIPSWCARRRTNEPDLPMRAKKFADREGLALSRRQHEYDRTACGRDSWALAQLLRRTHAISKSDYLGGLG